MWGGDEKSCLVPGVAGVPQGVAEKLAGSCGGVDHFEGDSCNAKGFGWLVLPVGLRHLIQQTKRRRPQRWRRPSRREMIIYLLLCALYFSWLREQHQRVVCCNLLHGTSIIMSDKQRSLRHLSVCCSLAAPQTRWIKPLIVDVPFIPCCLQEQCFPLLLSQWNKQQWQ